jgi:TonB family protein
MIIRRILPAYAIMLAITPANLLAREWGSVAGWAISPGKQSCGMYAQARDGSMTDAVFLKRLDGSIVMQLQNPSWNIPTANVKRIQFRVDNQVYLGPVSVTTTLTNPQRNIIAAFGSDFERELKSGSVLALMLDGRVIDQISLSGSAVAIVTVQNCLNDLRSGKTTETQTGAGFASLPAKPPVPTNNPSEWITMADYPSAAERDRKEGTVAFRLTVGKNGRTIACVITKSSGSADLDAATCKAMARRTKFAPAVDPSGNPVEGTYESRVTWKLPGN